MSFYEKAKEELIQFALVLSVISVGWLTLSHFFFKSEQTPKTVAVNQKTFSTIELKSLERANHHLKVIDHTKELNRVRAELQSDLTTPINNDEIDEAILDQRRNEWGISLESDDVSDRLQRRLEGKEENVPYRERPADRIEARLANEDFLREYWKAYDEEYVNEFVANVEKAGYKIELNDKMEVVGLKRIKKKSPILFSND